MINKINFTGRETMLTKGVKEVASKAHEYVGAGKVFSDSEIAAAKNLVKNAKIDKPLEKDVYTSPFAPTEETAQVVSKKAKRVQDETNGYLYNVAHGKPNNVADENVTETQAILNLLA